jgi:hypothetical protein
MDKFKEYLTGLGLTDEQVSSIAEGMPENKFYISNEENIDERYSKLKEKHDSLKSETEEQQTKIQELETTVAENADEIAKIDEYKQQAEQAEAKYTNFEKTIAVKDALTAVGATDVDYLIFKLGGIDTLETDDKGNIKDLDNKVKDLQQTIPSFFKSETDEEPKDDKKEEETPKEDDKKGFQVVDNKLDDGKEETPDPFQAVMDKY